MGKSSQYTHEIDDTPELIGPLTVCVMDNGQQKPVQIGVISWGPFLCASSGNPGVYGRVSTIIDWMKSVAGTVQVV